MRAMLVYQGEIANVFKVTAFNLADYGRDAARVFQGTFRRAEDFARGMGAAGAIVRTAHCNRAGDISMERWSMDLDDAPFNDLFVPVKVG